MTLHILCGIPGSGKSTLSGQLSGYLVSTDQLRKFLWDDEKVVKHDKLVFNLAGEMIDYLLAIKHDVIFDATNLTRDKRKRFIDLAQKYNVKVILHWVSCPLRVALKRNAARERRVPEGVIIGLQQSFQKPGLEEGFDTIRIYDENHLLTKEVNNDT